MLIVTLICVVIVMYIRTLSYGYCIDDFDIAKKSMKMDLDSVKQNKQFWRRVYWSWQGMVYKDPVLAHVIAFVIHLCNTVLIYLVFGRNNISFLTALLFTLHPAGTQTSVWLSGKAYSTVIFFTLLMIGLPMLSPAFYWLAFTYGGFSATFIPAIFLTTNLWWLAALIPLGILVKWKRITTALGYKYSVTPKITKAFTPGRIMLYFKTLGYYAWMIIFPMRLGVYHEYLYTFGLSKEDTKGWYRIDLYFFFGILVFAGMFAMLIFNRTSPITYGYCWFVILVSQWCNYPITLQQAIAERYNSLPMLGAVYAIVNAIQLLPADRQAAAYAVLIAGYAVRLHLHIPSYRNIHFQIDQNLVNFPECYAIWTWKGQEEKNRGSFFTALEAWFQGWKLRKNDFRLNNNIAVMLTELGQLEQAEDFLKLAESNIPEDQRAAGMEYINNARARLKSVRQAEAIKSRIILPGGRR